MKVSLSQMTVRIAQALDQGVVDHQIHLRKLQYYGIKDQARDLIQSYLLKIMQKVGIGGVKSQGPLV